MPIFSLSTRDDRSKVFYAEGSVSGKRVRRSLETKDKTIARTRLNEFELGVINGTIKLSDPVGSRKVLFSTVARNFARSPRTGSGRTTLGAVEKLIDYFGDMQVKYITESEIDDYIEQVHLSKGNSNSTIRRELNTLQSILNFSAARNEREYIKVVKPPEDPHKHDTFTDEEMGILFPALHPDVHRICIFLRYTGCRPIEAVGLLYEDIDFENNKVVLRSIKGRSGKTRERIIPLHDKALAAIPSASPQFEGHVFKLNGQPIKHHWTLPSYFREARERVLPKCDKGMYALRHTFATTLARKGAPASVIGYLLGHTDLKMVMRYMNTTYDDHIKAISALN
jgi:integrase